MEINNTVLNESDKYRAFAFYRYQLNSLSLLCTSMNGDLEAELRDVLLKKLQKGLSDTTTGSVTTIDFSSGTPLSSYYTILHCDTDLQATSSNFSAHSIDSKSVEVTEYLLCFLGDTKLHLELFHNELDRFSSEVQIRLELDPNYISGGLQQQLSEWWEASTGYVARCINCLQDDIKYIVFAAMCDLMVCVKGENNPTLSDDVARFVDSCSLADLLGSGLKLTSGLSTPSLLSDDVPVSPGTPGAAGTGRQVLDITVDTQQGVRVNHNVEVTQLCENWSKVMVGKRGDTVAVKQVISAYRLKVIQDLNNLKRLLKQAEHDYYTLFRALKFLQASGNASVLLHLAQVDIRCSTDRDSGSGVLTALAQHLCSTAFHLQ